MSFVSFGKTLALGLLFMALSLSAYACSCASPYLPDAYEESDAIFHGKAVAVRYPTTGQKFMGERLVLIKFEIFENFKGAASQEFILHTVQNEHTCNGYLWTQGEEYLIFAKKDVVGGRGSAWGYVNAQNVYDTSLCSGTRFWRNAEEAATELRTLRDRELSQ